MSPHRYLLIQGAMIITFLLSTAQSVAADPITVHYSETATINSVPMTISGTAQGDPSLGTYNIQIQYSAAPPQWDLLSVFLAHSSTDRIYSKEIDIGYGLGTNFFTLTGGNLNVSRTVTYLDQHGNLIGTASFSGQLARLDESTINLTGNIIASGNWSSVGNVVSIEPYTEMWTPDGPGTVRSSLTIPYLTSSGMTVLAETSSVFSFDPSVSLSASQLGTRNYTFIRLSDTAFAINFSGTIAAVPEPATLLLLGTGVTGVLIKARTKLKTRSKSQGRLW